MLVTCLVLPGCVSTTLIRSVPSGAEVYMNQEFIGVTPCEYRDAKIIGSNTEVLLKRDGYEDLYATLTKNEEVHVGAAVATFFTLYCPFPILWIMKYKPIHTYKMTPLSGIDALDE